MDLIKKVVVECITEHGNTEYAYEQCLVMLNNCSVNVKDHKVLQRIDEVWDEYFRPTPKWHHTVGFVLLIVSLMLMVWSVTSSTLPTECILKMVGSFLSLYLSIWLISR